MVDAFCKFKKLICSKQLKTKIQNNGYSIVICTLNDFFISTVLIIYFFWWRVGHLWGFYNDVLHVPQGPFMERGWKMFVVESLNPQAALSHL